MKATGIVRNVDELGRIVVPKEIRTKMDILCNDPVEIFVEDDKIILKKLAQYCVFCGKQDDVLTFYEKKICRACLEQIKQI